METHEKCVNKGRRSINPKTGPRAYLYWLGSAFEWTSFNSVEINTASVLLVPGKRNSGERWVRLLIQKIWDVAWNQWEHIDEVVHKKENLFTQEEAEKLNVWIRKAIRIGQRLVLAGEKYLFHNMMVDSAFQWTLARKKYWKQFVETA
jgi:hypothetical protein